MRFLTGFIRSAQGIVRRPAARQFDLDVTDQWVTATLVRFGDCSYRRIEAEVQAIRGVASAQVVSSILKLEEAGMIERGPVQGLIAEARLFRLTLTGRRVGRLIPKEPRSPTIFYL